MKRLVCFMVSVFSSSIINTATVFLHLLDNDFLSLGGFPGRQEIIQRCILIKNVFLGIVNQAFGNEFAIPIYVPVSYTHLDVYKRQV